MSLRPQSKVARALGHWWTIQPYLREAPAATQRELWRWRGPSGLSWTLAWSAPLGASARGVVILLHGLGARYDSRYMLEAQRVALARGFACVRVDTARCGELRVHGYTVLSQDLMALRAYLRDRTLATALLWAGFSLGGHALLSAWSTRPRAQELMEALLTICSPLELGQCLAHMDSPRAVFYRRRLLALLRQGQPRSSAPHKSLTSWANAQDHAAVMMAPLALDGLTRPCLMLSALEDPFVPPRCARRPLPTLIEQRWLRGGHLGFPKTAPHPLDEGLDWFEGLTLARRR